jgi:hypothetical protein
MHWTDRIGRRLNPHDLHIFMAVVEQGNMARAADSLAISRPVVSRTIAGLEHALGVRLLDRSPQGVEPTLYGRALLKRSVAVFDELKQSVTDIASLGDPNSGEVRIRNSSSNWSCAPRRRSSSTSCASANATWSLPAAGRPRSSRTWMWRFCSTTRCSW